MAAEGTEVETDDLMVTTGGQQVIDLPAARSSIPATSWWPRRPPIPAPCPCFNSYEAEVVQIEMDDHGMRIDVLEETLAKLRDAAAGHLRGAAPGVFLDCFAQRVMAAQPYIAQWVGEHPKWTAVKWRCEYPHANDRADKGKVAPAA